MAPRSNNFSVLISPCYIGPITPINGKIHNWSENFYTNGQDLWANGNFLFFKWRNINRCSSFVIKYMINMVDIFTH